MLNTSFGNISGLFKGKKEEGQLEEIETGEIQISQEKEQHCSFILNEEQDFEKDMSNISVSFETPAHSDGGPTPPALLPPKPVGEVAARQLQAENEVSRLRSILALKEEIRASEREKEKEAMELKTLELIKIQAQLEYEKKQRKILEQEIQQLKGRVKESELESMELVEYCKLLMGPEHCGGSEEK